MSIEIDMSAASAGTVIPDPENFYRGLFVCASILQYFSLHFNSVALFNLMIFGSGGEKL